MQINYTSLSLFFELAGFLDIRSQFVYQLQRKQVSCLNYNMRLDLSQQIRKNTIFVDT